MIQARSCGGSSLGTDAHHLDPLTSQNMTLEGYEYLVRRIKELTDFYSCGRLLALGGGGYNISVVPIAWALVLQTIKNDRI